MSPIEAKAGQECGEQTRDGHFIASNLEACFIGLTHDHPALDRPTVEDVGSVVRKVIRPLSESI
jgi:hypothetical protein